MEKTSVYKLDSKGKERVWSVWVIKNSDGTSTIHTESGLLDGNLVKEAVPITEGKNLGKSNATTPYTQAVAEAEAKLEQKLRSGYVKNLQDASSGVLGSGIPQCMLAQKHHPTGAQNSSKTLEQFKLKNKTVYVQPKIDGNRRIVKLTPDGEAVMYTRKGDVAKVQFTNILDQLKRTYASLGSTEEVILDGELFSSEMSFVKLNGLLNRKEINAEDVELFDKINYHLYDVMSADCYSKRYEYIKNYASKNVPIIPNYEIIATDENIASYLDQFLSDKQEGLMIRRLGVGYENKRSNSLLKVKVFEDAEFILADMKVDKMGRLSTFELHLDDDTGRTFEAGNKLFTHEEGAKVLENKDKYIGTKCTVEFFGRSEYNIPRHGKVKELNRVC